MTVIVGVQWEEGGKRHVLIGGDSAATSEWNQIHLANRKVVENRQYLIGYCGSVRLGQLLQYADLPEPPPGDSLDELHRFMVTEFVESVRKTLRDGGCTTSEDGREKGGTFLVAVRGVLYQVQDSFQVIRTIDRYQSIGSGQDFAFGALHALRNEHPKKQLEAALEAAEYHSHQVKRPFVVIGQVYPG